jgi:enoyl-CoA hydratase/carnithine racemase
VLGVFCRRFGVPLIDGGTVRLARTVGRGRAMDLVLTGRPVAAAEALHMGLVDRVVPADAVSATAASAAAGAEVSEVPTELDWTAVGVETTPPAGAAEDQDRAAAQDRAADDPRRGESSVLGDRRGHAGAELQGLGGHAGAPRSTPALDGGIAALRVFPALREAVALATAIVAHPYGCLLADRESLDRAWEPVTTEQALVEEFERGIKVVDKIREGAARFAEGKQGRHGKFR